jgi:hypothetical protein
MGRVKEEKGSKCKAGPPPRTKREKRIRRQKCILMVIPKRKRGKRGERIFKGIPW